MTVLIYKLYQKRHAIYQYLRRPERKDREEAMTLSIRRATDHDRQGIWSVHVRAISEVCSRSYSEKQITSWAGLLSPDSYVAVVRDRFLVVAED